MGARLFFLAVFLVCTPAARVERLARPRSWPVLLGQRIGLPAGGEYDHDNLTHRHRLRAHCPQHHKVCARGLRPLRVQPEEAAEQTQAAAAAAVVVVRCREPVDWIHNLTCEESSVVVYNKCEPWNATVRECVTLVDQFHDPAARTLRNHGSYVDYLVDNYGRFPPRVYFTKATLRGFSKLAMSPADEFVSFVRKSKSRSIGYYHFGMTKLGTWTPNSLFQLTPMATFKCGRWNTTGSSTRSTFAVSRNRLYQWPLCYYQRLKDFLVRMGNRGNVEPALYAMERIYNSMFKCFVHNCGESGEECQGNIYCDERTTKLTSSSKIWKRPMKLPARPNDGSFGKADKKAFYGIWRSKTNTFWRRNT